MFENLCFNQQIIWYLLIFSIFIFMLLKRTQSLAEMSIIFRIKDLHFFKILMISYEVPIMKQFLYLTLSNIILPPLTCLYLEQDKYVYIPAENIHSCKEDQECLLKAGYAIDFSINRIESSCDVLIYVLPRHVVLILEQLFCLQIPLMKQMKNMQKFQFLLQCEVLLLNFNCFAYRKGDAVEAIYYIIEGQINIYKQVGQKIIQVLSLERGKLFGLYELKANLKYRQLFTRSGINVTKILKIPLIYFKGYCNDHQISFDHYFRQFKSELHYLGNQKIKRIQYPKDQINNQPVNLRSIDRRFKLFQQKKIKSKNKVLEDFVLSKKLIYKIKQLKSKQINNQSILNHQKQDIMQKIKRSNDIWMKKKEFSCREQRQTTAVTQRLASRESIPLLNNHNNQYIGIKGLAHYPSVKRYLSKTQGIEEKQNNIDSID